MAIDLKKVKHRNLGFFRFKKLGRKYLLTNDVGFYVFLAEKEFEDFLQDKLKKDGESYLSLIQRGFVRDKLDINDLIGHYRAKNSFLMNGPALHIVIPTLRCNHRCVYCHASAQNLAKTEFDMDEETARLVVDKIFESPSPFIAIEFQGGEPLVNWEIVRFIVEYAYKVNKKKKKRLDLRLVSNMSLMTQKKFKYLLDKKVSLCTSLDGPEFLHNKNRPLPGGNSYRKTAEWIKKFNRRYKKLEKKGYVSRIGSLVTVSRWSLPRWKEIIDEYVGLGFSSIYLRFLNPFGFSLKHMGAIAYSPKEFLDFYNKALSYILEINLGGKGFSESMARTFLVKILVQQDMNNLDIRSPCGAGIGQLAYNYNGNVYTCDEGRMFSMMGDESFRLGNVKENTYSEIVDNPVVRSMCTASCLEGQAGCSDCVYSPYCGVCPVYNYFVQGNLFGQMPTSQRCQMTKGMLDVLFEKIQDSRNLAVFERWLDIKRRAYPQKDIGSAP